MPSRIADWVRPAVRQMSAYQVPPASGMIKLDAMENPYSLPAALRSEWISLLEKASFNRYPDPSAKGLKQQIRRQFDISGDHGLVLGNGSDELIQMLALATGGEGRSILSVEPTFVMYRMIADMNGLGFHGVALNADDFSLDPDRLSGAIESHQPAVVFIANPNNPTGNIFDPAALARIADACPGLMVVDEAYAPFTDVTATALLQEYDHVLIMRTVSKMGMAGLRLGYLFGSPKWTGELEKVRLPYNINVLSQISAEFALRNKRAFDTQAARIKESRQRLFDNMVALDGVRVWPSEANFILFRVADSQRVHESLEKNGVLIKLLHGSHPLLENCLRVTVGTEEENSRFLEELKLAINPDAVSEPPAG